MWTLSDDALAALSDRLAAIRPKVAVEAGSGRSTRVLAEHCGHVVTLEHLLRFAEQTRRMLDRPVDLRCVPLVDFDTPEGAFPWYDTDLPERIDFALVDGPPAMTAGRQAAGFALLPRLAGEMWLDDADRRHEQECLRLWSRHFDLRVEQVTRSMVRITR